MAIKIVPHAEDKKDLVEGFNAAMREGGSRWGFYVDPDPKWVPKTDPDQSVWREYHLAIENGERCVGGYGLKPQRWIIRGEHYTVADWQGPMTLGAVDDKYAVLGLRMIRDMLKKSPLLYSWGHGSDGEPIVQLIEKMGWLMHQTPFLFRVTRPRNFLRKNRYLRHDKKRALAQDVLAFTGLGTLAVRALHLGLQVKAGKRFTSRWEEVSEFGPWADELWERVKGEYAAIAVRDAAAMNAMIPAQHVTTEWPPPVRLRVVRNDETVGWAVVVERQLRGDPRFGDMRVGMVADYLARPEDGGEVIHAAFQYLRKLGVDAVFANQSHPTWIRAFLDNGFVSLGNRRLFCASPKFQAALDPFDETKTGLFLSNFDGHGPIL